MGAVAGASTGGVEAVSVRAALARPPAALIAAALLGVTLILLPIFYTVIEAASVDFRDAVDLLIRPLVATLLFNTVSLVIAASLASAIIGTAAAWVVERTDVPGRNVWSALIAAPLAIPPFVTSFAWVSMSNALQDFAGALLVVTCAYFPLVYLPVAAALRELDPALEETARSLGESAGGCFLRVVLPQLRPALLGGVLLVALNTLTEFGAFALLRFRTFTTELYAQYRTELAGPESSLIALVLVALCLALVFAEFRVRGDARYARVGAGARRVSAPAALGWSRLPVLGVLGALVAATVGVPIGMIGFWLFQHAQAATSPVAPTSPELIRAALNSIGYGLSGAAAALVLAAPIGYLAVRFPSPWTALMERAAYLAQGVPGIVVALALISLTVQWVGPLYQSPALLVVAYAILFSAACSRQRPGDAHANSAGPRGSRAFTRPERRVGRLARRRASGRAWPRRRRGAGVHLRLDRIDGDLAPLADRDADAGDGGLGQHVVGGLCGGRAVRRADALPVARRHLAVRQPAEPRGVRRLGLTMARLSVKRLTKAFAATPVLRGVDLEVAPGSLVAVLGASGSGKTTLLRLLLGLRARGFRLDRNRRANGVRPRRPRGPGKAPHRLCGAGRLALSPSFGRRQCRLWAAPGRAPQPAEGGSAPGQRRSARLLREPRSPSAFPEASSSVSRWLARWRRRQNWCCSTSPSPRSTRR